ncbi:MAG: zinc ribbon domain-containing protein [Halanaeroarchaeum sp.]
MSKITFRADEDLVDAIEDLEASKSEVMREALRAYLGVDSSGSGAVGHRAIEESLEDLVARRVDERLDERLGPADASGRDVTVYVEFDGQAPDDVSLDRGATTVSDGDPVRVDRSPSIPSDEQTLGRTPETTGTCAQCGVDLDPAFAYCPNCGEHTAPAFYCECGAELDREWSFCPTCGRRTASPDVPEP